MTTTTQATATETTTTRNIWIKEWNEEAVLIEDRLDKYKDTWVPRTAIKQTTFIKKRDFHGEIHFIYDAEIDTEWWKQNVRYRGFRFETPNGHRKGWRSDD